MFSKEERERIRARLHSINDWEAIEAFDTIDALEAENARLKESVAKANNTRGALLSENNRVKAENARLREALNATLDYAGHLSNCPAGVYSVGVPVFCKCGWDKVSPLNRAALAKEPNA